MTRIQNNVSERNDMSTRRLLFHYKDTTKWCFTIKIQLMVFHYKDTTKWCFTIQIQLNGVSL